MRKRLALLILCLPLCGCMHAKSIDAYAFVLNVGVEKGTTMPYTVSFLVSVPGDGTETTKVENKVITAEARTFSEAVNTLNAAYPSRLNFSRASLLALQEELVRSGEQTAFLDFSFGKSDLWQNLRVVVVAGSVRETFEGWVSESDPSLRKIKTAVGELSAQSGLSADAGYSAYTEAVSGSYCDAMLAYAGVNTYGLRTDLVGDAAYPLIGGSLPVDSLLKTTTAGSAVFDGDRMVGVLDGRHTMAVLMVTDAFRRGEVLYTLPDARRMTVVLYRMRKPKIRLYDGAATVELYLEADPSEPQTIPMDSETLKTFLKARLEEELFEVFSALQRANSDAMGFGRFAARAFRTVEDWQNYDWKADYRKLTVMFSVQVKLAHNPHDAVLE